MMPHHKSKQTRSTLAVLGRDRATGDVHNVFEMFLLHDFGDLWQNLWGHFSHCAMVMLDSCESRGDDDLHEPDGQRSWFRSFCGNLRKFSQNQAVLHPGWEIPSIYV
jgi:hypothetical protein